MREIKNADDVAIFIAIRDGIELQEARLLVEGIQWALYGIAMTEGIEKCEAFLMNELGLGPDYLEILL